MKQLFISCIMLACAIVACNVNLYSQTSHTPSPFVVGDAGTHSELLEKIRVKNVKTFDHFTKNFSEAIVKIVRNEKDGTYINATISGNTLRVKYDSKGRFQNSVLTYPHTELTDELAEKVMVSFPGYTIFGNVIDVKVRDKSALLVLIENKKTWKRVRITSEGIDVYEDFVKSK